MSMLNWFWTAVLKDSTRDHVLSDEAVLHAVNLGAMVHNLLNDYEQGIASGNFSSFHQKMYEVSAEFRRPEVEKARENLRQEWVRRATREPRDA